MIQPLDLQATRPMRLHDGVVSTTTDVWSMLMASWNGDQGRVRDLAARCPALLTCQYDYTSPLHLAVNAGHLGVVRYLVEHQALDPGYQNHPFLESLVVLAEDREHREIAGFLSASLGTPELVHEWGDTGHIERGQDEVQRKFLDLVDHGIHGEVESMLTERPELALDPDAFWGEGVLSVPAKSADRPMLELLLRFGARVPDVTKWGARYYFKHYEIAALLMANGMSPEHRNWRGFTLLHEMAFTGDVEKARLLLDHGASIDPIDDEYCSTPLGYAAHWGQGEIVALLLERGADMNRSGAGWATPHAWARKKGHFAIEGELRRAGAARRLQ